MFAVIRGRVAETVNIEVKRVGNPKSTAVKRIKA
jgi:hypothetical protein